MAPTPALRRPGRPVWIWPLLALPPAALGLLLIDDPAAHRVLLVLGLVALPLIRRAVTRRRVGAAAAARIDDPLQLGWLAGGSGRALDVAMARLLSIGALRWQYDRERSVWSYRRVAEVRPPAELDVLHRLCSGGAQPWQLQMLAPSALGAPQWTLVERGWWVDDWTSIWARIWSSAPLLLILLASLVRLPAAYALGLGPTLLALQALAVVALVANALYAPSRTRAGARVLAAWRLPAPADPVEALCWRVAVEGPTPLEGTAAAHWAQIRASGADRQP